MNLVELYKNLYQDLIKLASVAGIDEKGLQKYFAPNNNKTEDFYFERLCASLQNSGNMSNSIKLRDGNDGNRVAIKAALCDFNLKSAYKKFNGGESIYEEFTKKQGIEDKGSKSKRETNWEKYSIGIWDGIKFLKKEKGVDTINILIADKVLTDNALDENIETIKNIQGKIHGLGFALTCDWLKECGCEWLAKPDVHIRKVLEHVYGLDNIKEEDVLHKVYEWSETINSESTDKKVTAYKIDKMPNPLPPVVTTS